MSAKAVCQTRPSPGRAGLQQLQISRKAGAGFIGDEDLMGHDGTGWVLRCRKHQDHRIYFASTLKWYIRAVCRTLAHLAGYLLTC